MIKTSGIDPSVCVPTVTIVKSMSICGQSAT